MTTPTLEFSDTTRTEGTRRVLPAQARGLCRTCAKEPYCTLPRAPDRPVLQCEEMETLELPMHGTNAATGSSRLVAGPAEPTTLRGLCVNCERREDCTFPRPPEGVWRCEEYV